MKNEQGKEILVWQDGRKMRIGLSGIMSMFNCSRTTAKNLKDGLLKPAVYQHGKLIFIDEDLAYKLFENNGKSDGNNESPQQ